jgi:hypothetical protein
VLRIRIRILIRIHRIHMFLGLLDPDPAFYHQAKKVRKALIPTAFDFENDLQVPSKSNKQQNFFYISFLLASWEGQ